MKPWLRLEWRELMRSGAGAWLAPLLAAAVAAAVLPPAAGTAALAGLAAVLAMGSTARRVWREQHGGGFGRLRLTPAPTGRIWLLRLLARALVLVLQFSPILALALWRRLALQEAAAGGAGAIVSPAAGSALVWAGITLLGTGAALLAGIPLGAMLGLTVRRWRTLHLLVAGCAAVLLLTVLLL